MHTRLIGSAQALIFTLIFSIQGLNSAAQQLSVGSRIDEHVAVVSAYIGEDYTPIAQEALAYHPSLGSVAEVARSLVTKLAKSFKAPAGKEGGKYQIFVEASAEVNGLPFVIANSTRTFSLVKSGNSWVVPETELAVNLAYQPYLAYSANGATGVTYLFEGESPIETRNGVYDASCDLYYRTNDVLYFPNANVVGGKKGAIVLSYPNGSEKYDLVNGDLVASTRLRLSLRRAGNEFIEIVILGGIGGSVVIESSTDLLKWSPVGTVSGSNAVLKQKTIPPRLFYRALRAVP